MSETADPVAALAARDIPTRAAAARDLAESGLPIHLDALVACALEDRSPGVRLGAAAAAADILSRARLGPSAAHIPDAERAALWGRIRVVDPGINPGIFQVCGTLGVPDAVGRIFGAMRDPRADVRQGACVGLWRLCASAAVNGDVALEARVVALFDDPRVRPDTQAELARACGVVGYRGALTAVRRLVDTSVRAVAVMATEAQQRLEWPPPLGGVWIDLGLDGGAVDVRAQPGDILVIFGTEAVVRAPLGAAPRREPLVGPVRQLWLKRPGATEATAAVQIGALTCWAADPDEISELCDRILAAEAFSLLSDIDGLLPITASAARLRGVAHLHAGDVSAALGHLEAAVELKKVPADTWWYLAEALTAAGRADEAGPPLERYLAKVSKRAPFVAEARRRLGLERE